jgi:hypothetical protein
MSTATLPPEPLEHGHIAAQLVNLDRRLGRLRSDQVDEHAGLGKDLPRRQKASGSGERRRTNAAKTKAASCERILARGSHGALLLCRLNVMGDDTRYHHITVVLLRRFRASCAVLACKISIRCPTERAAARTSLFLHSRRLAFRMTANSICAAPRHFCGRLPLA